MSQGVFQIELVESYDEVKQNVQQFNHDLEAGTDLISQLAQFRHWYYIPELDMFGPSKFIGYKNMTTRNYNRGHRTPEQRKLGMRSIDGRDTVKTLRKWFEEVKTPAVKNKLETNLASFLAKYNKTPKSNHIIHIARNSRLEI